MNGPLPPDPNKVLVHGPGVEHGILPTFESKFYVETEGAGAGNLSVKMRGPRGEWREILPNLCLFAQVLSNLAEEKKVEMSMCNGVS